VSQKKSRRPGFFVPAAARQDDYVLAPPPQAAYQQPAQPSPTESLTVQVTVLSDPQATVARATLFTRGAYEPVLAVTGSSRVQPGDSYDEEIGTLYATARALRRMASRMEHHADGGVRSADSARRQRTRAREKENAGVLADPWASLMGTAGITVHIPEGMTADDIPQEVRDVLATMFPGAEVGYEGGAASRGKHAKPEA
jgi:hypothetical protein